MPACQSAAGADSGPTAAGGQPQAEGEAQPERAPVTDSDPRRHGGATGSSESGPAGASAGHTHTCQNFKAAP
jgi:hypothetical protein